MKKRISLPVFILSVVVAIVITFQVTSLSMNAAYGKKMLEQSSKSDYLSDKFNEIKSIVESYFLFKDGIDEEKIGDEICKKYLEELGDKYTYYMDKEAFKVYSEDAEAKMTGIGVSVVYNEEFSCIEVIEVFESSPAEESGISIGDLIVRVGEENVSEIGYEEAVSKIKGEEGTLAKFTVKRDGKEIEFSVERKQIISNSVSFFKYDGKTGVIRISEFNLKTPEQFKNAISTLKNDGIDRFVFDVRNNPGGDLDSITEILDYLLPEGPIVRMIDVSGKVSTIDSDANEFSAPFAVVTNGNTASAAELFTSALKDYKKALIVGETTFGKGIMQSVVPLSDGSGISITTGFYNPPFSENYHKKGITPNIEVSLPDEYKNTNIYKLTKEQDTQLSRAVEELEK